jgi:hypothetical protein
LFKIIKHSKISIDICQGLVPEYHRSPVTAHETGHDRFPPVTNGWKTIYSVLDSAPSLSLPPLLAGDDGVNLKRIILRNKPHWSSLRCNGRGRTGSFHLSNHCGSSSRPDTLRPPLAGTPRGTPVPNKHHSNWALGRPRLLRPDVIDRN